MTTPARSSQQITVTEDGRLLFVYDDTLQPLMSLGPAQVRRASHVEPRADNSPVGGEGYWTADLSPIGGPRLGPFPLREQALAAERYFLQSPAGTALLINATQPKGTNPQGSNPEDKDLHW